MQHHSFYIAEQFTRGRLPHQEEQIWGCLWLRRQLPTSVRLPLTCWLGLPLASEAADD